MVNRWRGWSLRTRLTVLDAVALTVTSVILLGIALTVLSVRLEDHLLEDLRGTAGRVEQSLKRGFVARPVPTGFVGLIQVVNEQGRIIATTPSLSDRPVMADFRPPEPGMPVDRRVCDSPVAPGECLRVLVVSVDTPPQVEVVGEGREPGGRWLIYTALPQRYLIDPFAALLAGAALATIAVNAFLTYRVIGKTLAPVGVIRRELAEITATDLGRRVTVPESHGEIEELAGTVNQTLDLLEGLVERQRRFASDASHDLRSPLTAIRAQVEEARLAPEDTDWEATMTAILAGVDRLQAIIEDLLMIARLDAGAPQARDRVDLADLVRAELDRRRPFGPELRARLEPGVVVVGDPLRLSRVLVNLLDNAERHAESLIEVVVRREPGRAVLEVIDDGAGIRPEDREVVFQRFARLDAARSRDAGGTGLGLPIARQVAEAHGGTLTIEDSPVGARFVLRLPAPDVSGEAASRSR